MDAIKIKTLIFLTHLVLCMVIQHGSLGTKEADKTAGSGSIRPAPDGQESASSSIRPEASMAPTGGGSGSIRPSPPVHPQGSAGSIRIQQTFAEEQPARMFVEPSRGKESAGSGSIRHGQESAVGSIRPKASVPTGGGSGSIRSSQSGSIRIRETTVEEQPTPMLLDSTDPTASVPSRSIRPRISAGSIRGTSTAAGEAEASVSIRPLSDQRESGRSPRGTASASNRLSIRPDPIDAGEASSSGSIRPAASHGSIRIQMGGASTSRGGDLSAADPTANLTFTQLLLYVIQRAGMQRAQAQQQENLRQYLMRDPIPLLPLQPMRFPNTDVQLPTEGAFLLANLELYLNAFYNLPRSLLRNVDDLTPHPFIDRQTRAAYHLSRFADGDYDGGGQLQFYIGTVENRGEDVELDFYHQLTQQQIANYFGLFDTNNHFDVRHFQMLPLQHFLHVRNGQFLIRVALNNMFESFNEPTRKMGDHLYHDILGRCEPLLVETENAAILCMLAHVFAFAVQFHREITDFGPFYDKVLHRMHRYRPEQMDRLVFRENVHHAFNPFLTWLRMKPRVKWMEESALAIFARYAQSRPFGAVIDSALTAQANLLTHLECLFKSYQPLARLFIRCQGLESGGGLGGRGAN